MDRLVENLDFTRIPPPEPAMSQPSPHVAPEAVPTFFLYGEPRRSVGPRFLHLETLEHRSRPIGWTIRPHAHADLHQIFLIATGAGTMQADGATTAFAAPCLLILPARIVHAFAWQPETTGQVLTLADTYLRRLLEGSSELSALFDGALCIPLAAAVAPAARLAALSGELAWSSLGHEAAVDATLLLLLVDAVRQQEQAEHRAHPTLGRAAQLVARFRTLVEADYRRHRPIAEYSAALCVTPTTLRRACAEAAACPPATIVRERVFLEAQRLLLYTNMTAGEAAAHLGFEDAAYFTRFFTQRAACSPGRFRRTQKG